jgi:hypothetical protein
MNNSTTRPRVAALGGLARPARAIGEQVDLAYRHLAKATHPHANGGPGPADAIPFTMSAAGCQRLVTNAENAHAAVTDAPPNPQAPFRTAQPVRHRDRSDRTAYSAAGSRPVVITPCRTPRKAGRGGPHEHRLRP